LPSSRERAPEVLARGQKDDAAPVRIPTPQELGLGERSTPVSNEPLDWTKVEARMTAAGVSKFDMQKDGEGFRCVCQLGTRTVAGRGASRSDAVRDALAQLPQ
jgi:hypothetical protein